MATPDIPAPPIADAVPETTTLHEDARTDEYAWLRNREDPRVLPHLQAERAHAEAFIDAHAGKSTRADLYAEMRGRIKEDDQSVPVLEYGYWYYSRDEAGKEYPIHCRRKGTMDAPEEVYLDENAMAEGHEYFSLDSFSVTRDGRWLAYALDTTGDEIYTVRILDLDTGEHLPEAIEGAATSLVWANDEETLFYDLLDAAHRPYKAMRHQRGTDPANDTVVYEETDEAFYLGIYRSRDDRWILFSVGSQVTSETRMLLADEPHAEPTVFAPRQQDVEYSVTAAMDRLYIVTNEGAKNFRMFETTIDKPERAHWVERMAHRPDVLLVGVEAFVDHLVVWERTEGLRRLRVLDRVGDDAEGHLIDFPDPAYTVSGSRNPNFDSATYRFGYSSPTRPGSVFAYDLHGRARTLLKQREVVGGYDAEAYTCERHFVEANDGARIPVTVVYRNDFDPNTAPRPTLLYGYGAYGSSMDARFSSARLSLLDRGMTHVVAHVRGGSEMGRPWYDDGKLAHKHNTFDDFIRCGDWLVEQQRTTPAQLVAMGGSAGGLLMGAVANARPDLFHAIVADVPFVDVLNTLLDPSLPLTVVEWEEWGNPQIAEQYAWIRAYSPYDNVTAQDYPHMLVLAGLNDPRVGYWEPAKWVARLRERKTDDRALLLWTNLEAGHGGASGRFEYLHEVALEYAFVLERLGLVGG